MEELIRKSDAIKSLDNAWINGTSLLDANETIKQLNDLPSADRPHGEWIEDYNNTYSRCRMKCSACGKFSGIGGIKSNQRKPYCPNCGARMEGE